MSNQLKVTCISAQLTRDTEMFSNMDPYVVIQCGSDKKKTRTHQEGGKRPSWNDSFTFVNPMSQQVKLAVWDEDNVTDDLVGEGVLDISKYLSSSNKPQKEYVSLTYKSKPAGKLYVQVEYISTSNNKWGSNNNTQGWGSTNDISNIGGNNNNNHNSWGNANNNNSWGTNNNSNQQQPWNPNNKPNQWNNQNGSQGWGQNNNPKPSGGWGQNNNPKPSEWGQNNNPKPSGGWGQNNNPKPSGEWGQNNNPKPTEWGSQNNLPGTGQNTNQYSNQNAWNTNNTLNKINPNINTNINNIPIQLINLQTDPNNGINPYGNISQNDNSNPYPSLNQNTNNTPTNTPSNPLNLVIGAKLFGQQPTPPSQQPINALNILDMAIHKGTQPQNNYGTGSQPSQQAWGQQQQFTQQVAGWGLQQAQQGSGWGQTGPTQPPQNQGFSGWGQNQQTNNGLQNNKGTGWGNGW